MAAVGSWLFARAGGGLWSVRVEDLDRPRVVAGAEDEILRSLERCGLFWDGAVVRQSERVEVYEAALERLRAAEAVFDCACSRAELARAASAPSPSDATEPGGLVYPGTCRQGLPPGRKPRAVRLRVPPGTVAFVDAVFGRCEEETASAVGDFVVRRADGPFAYQLAVVVDDALQGVTQVVRGADLLSSTPRQVVLQRALGLPAPSYAHLPLVLGPDGRKLGKRDGALPFAALSESATRAALRRALAILGQEPVDGKPAELLAEAALRFDPASIPRAPVRLRADGRLAHGLDEDDRQERHER